MIRWCQCGLWYNWWLIFGVRIPVRKSFNFVIEFSTWQQWVILSLHTLDYRKTYNYYNSDSTYKSKYEVIINIELYIIFSSILICMLENKHIYCSVISEHYVYNQQVLLLELVKFKVHVYTFQYIMYNIWCKCISHMKKT